MQQPEPAPAPSYEPRREARAGTREIVPYFGPHGRGTVIVNTRERRLYYVLGDGKAVRYVVGVGREGFQWAGAQRISNMQEWPEWRPPAQMIKRRPDLPRYMAGGPHNPLGARALYLGGSLFRIHGSNEPETIGQAVSSGCIRMLNEDVVDLYERVRIGTQVVVLR
nr:L,D-transpeptidase [Variibacter gotjawalensis]